MAHHVSVPVAVFAALLLCCTAAFGVQYDKDLFAKRLNETIHVCKSLSNESCALEWIDSFGRYSDYFTNIMNRVTYAHANHIENEGVKKEMLSLSDVIQAWGLRNLKIARQFRWRQFSNYSLRRRFLILTQDITLEDGDERRELTRLQQSLLDAYSKTSACPEHGRCLPVGEQAVTDAMQDGRLSYDQKQAIWRSWYDKSASVLRADFTRYAELANKAARQQGFPDAGQADWRFDFESDSFNSDVLAWLGQITDLYQQLHAYARHRLARRHPGRFDPAGCLPAHITGHDQWGQQWQLPLEDFPYPERTKSSINYTAVLLDRFGNFSELVKAAEEFYVSLGMPAMTQTFWNKSDFYKPKDPAVIKDCHASAWDFASKEDFRIKMCGTISREDFYVIHHEMGHIQYFMAYNSRQPREFRSSPNSGFHEAIGDTMALSVDTPTHYATLGLIGSSRESQEEELNSMFAVALNKLPFLPFALTTGVFRWLLFNGTAGPSEYNRVWWRLRAEHGGVCPPVDRPEVGFDAGAKYHVAIDISYIRYYFSFMLQFQLHRRMCRISGHTGPVHRCDFYRSKPAGRKFMKMLQAGSSRPWQETLNAFTDEDGLQTSAILEYFKPLHDWLSEYNRRNNVPVGWRVPDDVLKGVSR